VLERLRGALRLVGEAETDALAYQIEALVQCAGEMSLGALRLVGELAQAAGHLGQPVFELRGPPYGFVPTLPLRPPGQDNSQNQEDEGGHGPGDQEIEECYGRLSDLQKDTVERHGAMLA
jgi:hypothetical protein